jgi:hypothetical protein
MFAFYQSTIHSMQVIRSIGYSADIHITKFFDSQKLCYKVIMLCSLDWEISKEIRKVKYQHVDK